MCIDNCNNKIYKKGYCRKHYDILNKQGKIEITTEEIQERINKYDKDIIYLSGYINCHSIIRCKCNRCENIFERRYENITRHNTEYCCPICQNKLARKKQSQNQKGNSCCLPHKSVEQREQEFIKKFNNRFPTLEYIGGYQHSEKPLQVKCRICNHIYNVSAQCIRKGHKTICINCVTLESKKQKEQKRKATDMIRQQAKHINDIKLNKRKEIKRIHKELIRNTQYIQTCKKCKNEFIEHSNSAYCPLCRKRINHHHSYKSLKKLYERDKGVCHICNGICNWNDKRIDKGTIIVGNTYPSIDHIIPLAKGGTDEWNNLGLAHVRCNTIKGVDRGVVA